VINREDEITQIRLVSDMHGVHYDFCELLPVSISGKVHVNTTGDCDNPANPPLANVTIELLNSTGSVIDTTQTDANGRFTLPRPAGFVRVTAAKDGYLIHPGFRGGPLWGGCSFDPKRNRVFVSSDETSNVVALEDAKPPAS
jgi:hypothetical protein